MSFSEFLHMGGYAAFVWSAFGLTAVVLVGLEWSGRLGLQQAQRQAVRRVQMSNSQ